MAKEMFKDTFNKGLLIYYILPGLTVGFYATFIYKLVIFSLPQEPYESDDDYHHRISFKSGLVFIVLGGGMAFTGLSMKYIAKKIGK